MLQRDFRPRAEVQVALRGDAGVNERVALQVEKLAPIRL